MARLQSKQMWLFSPPSLKRSVVLKYSRMLFPLPVSSKILHCAPCRAHSWTLERPECRRHAALLSLGHLRGGGGPGQAATQPGGARLMYNQKTNGIDKSPMQRASLPPSTSPVLFSSPILPLFTLSCPLPHPLSLSCSPLLFLLSYLPLLAASLFPPPSKDSHGLASALQLEKSLT